MTRKLSTAILDHNLARAVFKRSDPGFAVNAYSNYDDRQARYSNVNEVFVNDEVQGKNYASSRAMFRPSYVVRVWPKHNDTRFRVPEPIDRWPEQPYGNVKDVRVDGAPVPIDRSLAKEVYRVMTTPERKLGDAWGHNKGDDIDPASVREYTPGDPPGIYTRRITAEDIEAEARRIAREDYLRTGASDE